MNPVYAAMYSPLMQPPSSVNPPLHELSAPIAKVVVLSNSIYPSADSVASRFPLITMLFSVLASDQFDDIDMLFHSSITGATSAYTTSSLSSSRIMEKVDVFNDSENSKVILHDPVEIIVLVIAYRRLRRLVAAGLIHMLADQLIGKIKVEVWHPDIIK